MIVHILIVDSNIKSVHSKALDATLARSDYDNKNTVIKSYEVWDGPYPPKESLLHNPISNSRQGLS